MEIETENTRLIVALNSAVYHYTRWEIPLYQYEDIIKTIINNNEKNVLSYQYNLNHNIPEQSQHIKMLMNQI